MKRIIQITSGRGAIECCWAVFEVMNIMLKEASKEGFRYDIIEQKDAPEKNTLYSVIIEFEGDLCTFINSWLGEIQFIAKSIFRPNHKSKNWFIGVNEIMLPDKSDIKINENDIEFQAIRSGGKGGQHVNKVSTAIRATHIPTGISVHVSNSRSQLQNKKNAIERLCVIMEIQNQTKSNNTEFDNWNNHNQLKRGNPTRIIKHK